MTSFRESAARMAERLRIMKKLQLQHREMGDEEITIQVVDLFNAGDQAALDLYDRELAEATGQVPLPLERGA